MKVRIIKKDKFRWSNRKIKDVFCIEQKKFFRWIPVLDKDLEELFFDKFDDAVNFLKTWDGKDLKESAVLLEVDLEAFQREPIIDRGA